jgi:hypothetical protein
VYLLFLEIMRRFCCRRRKKTPQSFPSFSKKKRNIPLLRRGDPWSETKGRGGFFA